MSRRSRFHAPVPAMPPGLADLLRGLSEAVLRAHPPDLHAFCADHVHKLLLVRGATERNAPTTLQQKIANAQAIIRERCKQRRERYDKNLEACLDDKTHGSEIRLPRSEIAQTERKATANDVNEKSDDVAVNDNDGDYSTSHVSESEFTKGETVVDSTEIQSTIKETVEEDICSADASIPRDLSREGDFKDSSSEHIDNVELEAEKSEEGELAEEREKVQIHPADELQMHNDQDSATDVQITRHQMDLEAAAITIQKVFRSFLFKSKTTSLDDATNVDINLFIDEDKLKDDINIINNKHRGTNRTDTVLQTVNEEKSLSLSTDDSSTLSSAATIIQAHVRGFLVRNKFNVNKSPTSAESPSDTKESPRASSESNKQTANEQKTKTVLNIHIVPEKDNLVSRDGSLLTCMDLPMDDSPLAGSLHASHDVSERRKQLRREDAVHSVTPPSKVSDETREGEGGGDDVALKHSSEFHEVVLPTNVSRSDTSIVRDSVDVQRPQPPSKKQAQLPAN